MTKRDIMVKAHQLAKTYEGHYIARLSLALRITWAEAHKEEEEMELKNMTLEQLRELLNAVEAEISSRLPKAEEKKMVLYTHDCKDSSKHHMGKYKHWAKKIESVDTTKTNGFAFGGDFLKVEAEHKIAEGSLIVEVCDRDITLYRVTETGKEQIIKTKTSSMSELIERAAAELNK